MSNQNVHISDAESHQGYGNSISLLYIDDEEDLLNIAKLFLERSGGFRVDTYTSARQALDLPHIRSYDAIVSDYQMPDMDGITFLKSVRENFGEIPFILFTGRGREEVVIEAINNGADFYLQKGGDPKPQFVELSHKVRQAVRRKRAERSLKESEKRLSDIIEFLPDATFAIDRSGCVIAWNRAIEEMTGVSSGEMLGKGDYEHAIPFYGFRRPVLIDMIDEPDEKITQYYTISHRSGNTITAETDLPTPKGARISTFIKTCPLYNQEGEIVGAIETIRDISDLKKAEESLSQSRETCHRILETSLEGMLEVNLSSCIVFVNTRLAGMLGYSPEEMIGRRVTDFILPEDIPDHQEKIRERFQGISRSYERRLVHKDGRILWTILSAVPVREGDTIIGSFGTITDITKRKIAEENLIQKSEELKASFEELSAADEELRAQYAMLAEKEDQLVQGKLHLEGIACNIPGVVFQVVCTSIDDLSLVYLNNGGKISFDLDPTQENLLNTFISRIHPDWRESFLSSVQNSIQKGCDWEYEGKYVKPSGEEIWFSGAALVQIKEGKTYFYGFLLDITPKKSVEVALRDSEEKFRSFVENANEIFYSMTPEGIFTYISPKLTDLLGYDLDEFIGKPASLFVHPEDYPRNREFFIRALATGKNLTGNEYRIQDKNGIWHWHSQTISRILDDEGRIVRVQGISYDISDRKKAEDALRESEEKFRSFVENANDFVFSMAPDGTFTYVSPNCKEMLGYTSDEMIGVYAGDFIHPDDLPHNREMTLMSRASGKKIRIDEYRVRDKKGTWHWHSQSLSPIFSNGGSFSGYQGIGYDITDRKKAEEALRESEEKFRSFVENVNDIIYSLTPEGIFTYVSPQWSELLGHDASEVIGKNFSQFIHTDDLPRCYEFVRQILTTGEKATGIEYRIRHRNGTWKLHATAGSPIRDETGRIVSFLGTCRDITESKKAENALRQANRQYNLLNSITRHDINNKITAIIGYLDLAEESITTPELAEYFGRIKTLTDAVRSQISFTRIYQDLGTQEPRWQDLGIIMPFSHIPGTIAFYSDLNGIEVYADMMMEKVFFNLLDNSIRHGQRVTGIRVYTRESDDGLVVVWEDNGSGIPDTDKEQIFERGFGRNTGLGMFLVREILSLTDITIAETGVAGTGARFEISVPKGMYRYGLQSNRTGQN